MTVIDEIAAERRRQIEVEGWTPEHDDGHDDGELARAGATYALFAASPFGFVGDLFDAQYLWPFHRKWWKPKDRRRDLIRAGALIVAEIERLDRANPKPGEGR